MIGSTVAEILTRLSEAEARPASGVARRAAGARRALCNLACDEAAKAAIVDAIPQLVALLSGGPESKAAASAAQALHDLASGDAGAAAIIDADAIPQLVALLSGGTESQAAAAAAGALCNLACDDAGRAAIIDADIAPLVALLVLLRGGPASKAAGYAARALDILACDDARKAAIVAADAIPPLVELLSCGPASKAAKRAAGALDCLASDTHTTAAVLEEVARTTADCSFCSSLHAKLRNSASEQLQAVVYEGTDAAALEHSIILARAVPLEKSVIDHAVERLREVMRRDALGLGSLEPPNEFMCPITLEKMRGVPPPPPLPPSPLASHAALPSRLPSLRHRPSGGVRRLLVRAVRYQTDDRRRQPREPVHPRAAPAGRARAEPLPEEAHLGVRWERTGCGGNGVQTARRDRGEPSPAAGCGQRAG